MEVTGKGGRISAATSLRLHLLPLGVSELVQSPPKIQADRSLEGSDRFDVFGMSVNGDVLHKYWDGSQYSNWEKFDGPFIGTPIATTWGAPNLDLWAVHPNGTLFHAYWRDGAFGIEDLGGKFTETPQVVHWAPGRIDIVGQFAGESQYRYKYFEPYSSTWSAWAEKGGDFISQPAIASWADNQLNVLGVDSDGTLKWQLWAGGQWYPAFDGHYDLGNTFAPFGASETVLDAEVGARIEQAVLNGH